MQLNVPQCTGQTPHSKNYLAQNINSGRGSETAIVKSLNKVIFCSFVAFVASLGKLFPWDRGQLSEKSQIGLVKWVLVMLL